jgi:hypothetical protein
MAILAAALLPLLALQGQFLRTAESLERAETILAAETLALNHIKALNLDQVPEGRFSTPYGEISWKSAPAAGPAAGRSQTGFPSRYVFTLYDIEVNINPPSGPARQFTLQGLGWHPTKAMLDTL